MKKLHLGCGKLYLNGYININIDIESKNADVKADITKLDIYMPYYINEIYVSHVLEHIKRYEIINVLLEWNRVLNNGGTLRIAVPDFEKVVKVYLKNHNLAEIHGFLNGGQKNNYDIHYCVFDFDILSELLTICGFGNISIYDPYVFLGDNDDYSKCYLPHLDKKGELMSLNIVCSKIKTVNIHNVVISNRIQQYCKLR